MSVIQGFLEEIKVNKTPETIFELFKNQKFPAFLDSSLINNTLGAFSIIVFDPFMTFTSKIDHIEVCDQAGLKQWNGDPLEHLHLLLKEYPSTINHKEIPFVSGCVGFLSYDLCNILEKLPHKNVEDNAIPDIFMGFYNHAIIFDHIKNKVFISVTSAGLDDNDDIDGYLKERINTIKKIITSNIKINKTSEPNNKRTQQKLISNFSKIQYMKTIERAKKYIYNGDIFQVNLSQRFKTNITEDPYNIYKRLRKMNPAPFSAYIQYLEFALLCSSPERFIKITERTIETRPIKGTRPRGKSDAEDMLLKHALLNSEKDKAEHTMIIDLERNDLGRVCDIGSLVVDKMLEVETYQTVFHLVSTVKGTLKPDNDVINCVKAAFPGGSITGAPKIRSMEIIHELEPVKRGIYTGSIGYIDFNGNCDFNIVIRTIVINGSTAHYNVGGGIVWDSDPEKEYHETLHKGKVLMKVLSKSSGEEDASHG